MKKVIKKKEKSVSEVTGTPMPEPALPAFIPEKQLIDNLTGIGGNEDFNKVVAKINEIINKLNGTV